LCVVAVAN